MFKSKFNLIAVVIILITIVGSIGASFLFYSKYKETDKKLTDIASGVSSPTPNADESETINKVGQLVEVPDEAPNVATINDVEKLKKETFFEFAKNGDKVLLYPKSQIAILYRPSSGKIVVVAPVNATPSAEIK